MTLIARYIHVSEAEDWIARGWSVVLAGRHHADYAIASKGEE